MLVVCLEGVVRAESPAVTADRRRSALLAQADAASQRDTIWRAVAQSYQSLLLTSTRRLQVPTVVGEGYVFSLADASVGGSTAAYTQGKSFSFSLSDFSMLSPWSVEGGWNKPQKV